jgi:hypothetical protein
MRWLLLLLALSLPLRAQLASPYSNSIYKPQIATGTGQSLPVIQLNGLTSSSTVGSSYSSGSLTVTGFGLSNVNFQVLGSFDNGATFYPLLVWPIYSPTSASTTANANSNNVFQFSLANVTHIQIVTTGTFTATQVQFLLTASPNTQAKSGGGGGGGGGSTVIPLGGTLQGTVDGSNRTFTLLQGGTPLTYIPDVLFVWRNIPLVQSVGFSIAIVSGVVKVTYTDPPTSTDTLSWIGLKIS